MDPTSPRDLDTPQQTARFHRSCGGDLALHVSSAERRTTFPPFMYGSFAPREDFPVSLSVLRIPTPLKLNGQANTPTSEPGSSPDRSTLFLYS
ncbi:hypothetical protein GCM10020221_21180 [Streptomyces thioluteus]|uniref:Uncharacterized protein n=1 Tax=Streptomyces thioluteus TaxID=66431 RepID=A0ABN3WR55_STRTU